MGITEYFSQLDKLAAHFGVDLKAAFEAAGVPDSTYYRAKNGTNALRYDTATRVEAIINGSAIVHEGSRGR